MDKLKLAHDYAIALINSDCEMQFDKFIQLCWNYADAMQAEADKRNKAEAEQKRKEIREILNDANTFIEREGQNFDDVEEAKREGEYFFKLFCRQNGINDVEEWQPDWSQAPDGYNWFCVGGCSGVGYFCKIEPVIYKDHYWFVGEDTKEIIDHGYQGDWQNSLRERPESLCEVDWRVAPSWAKYWAVRDGGYEALWCVNKPTVTDDCLLSHGCCSPAPSFGFTGNHIVERPHGF